jgi:hypothetical protein
MDKLISGIAAAILDYWKQLRMPKRYLLVVPTYSGRVLKALLSNFSGSAMIVRRSTWQVKTGHWKVNMSKDQGMYWLILIQLPLCCHTYDTVKQQYYVFLYADGRKSAMW